MASMACTVDGWRVRQSKAWFPSSGFASIGSSTGASLNIASNPTGNNKYTICVRIKTPNSSSIKSISAVSVTFTMYKANNNAGTLYGSLRSTYADSGTGDTADTYRTNAIGSEASATGYTTSYSTKTFTFSGTFAKNTYYYLFLYSKSNNDMYYTENSKFSPSATCTYTAPATYTVSYNANGGTGAPSAQTKTEDVTLTLSSTKPTRSAGSSSSTFKITGDANGGYFGTTTTTTTSITATKTTPITYTFSGWNTAANGTGTAYSSGGSYTANSGATLYAQWSSTNGTSTYSNNVISGLSSPSRGNSTVSSYKVTFNANGGSCSTADLTATKTRSYTFKGWAETNNATTTLANTKTYTSAKTLYAVWGSTDSGGSITLPTPTRTGYTFKGWSTSSTATSGTTGTYTPTSAVTLYATWQINTWAVTYYANGHGTAPAAQTKTYNQSLTLQPFIAQQTATGYQVSFNANNGTSTPTALTSTIYYNQTSWNTNSSGTGTGYASQASYTGNAALNLYAIWGTSNGSITLPAAISRNSTTETGYKITFNANGGTCSTAELTATNTRSYTFANWAEGSTSGTKYAAGASYTPLAAKTMYATWTESVTKGSITLPTPSRTGYTFKGWSTSSSATSGSTGSYTPTASTTLYATWQINTWTVSYNANGHGTAPSSQTKTYNQTLTLQSFIPQQTSTGYKVSFNANNGTSTPNALTSTIYHNQSSWNTNSSGTGTSYGSAGSYTANSGATLYAIWGSSNGSVTLPAAISRNSTTETGFKVTFNANGGTCSTSELTATNTRSYTFKQWAAGSTSGTGYNASTSYTPTGAVTMYATWNESVTKGSVTLPTPTRTGYTFKGWATSSSATSGTAAGTAYTPTAATTLYATWQINTWAINYNANGHGTAPASQTKTYNQALTLQAFIGQQTATGYTVSYNKNGGATTPASQTSTIYYNQSSWNTASNGSGDSYASKGSYTANTGATLYAIWGSSNGSITLPAAITRADTTENGFKVTFNANGGTCGTTEQVAVNTRKYAFSKWALNSASGTKYDAGASFTPTGTSTMYATWTESVVNGSITLPTASKTGHSFVGWGTSSGATTGVTGTYTPTGNVTLYAIFKANTFAVSYNANGYGTAPAGQTKTYGVNLTLQPFIANQTISGYKVSFNANGGSSTPGAITSNIVKSQTYWNTAANGSGTNYGSKATYSTESATTLYAIWGGTANQAITLPAAITKASTEVSHAITYDANGGTSTPASQTNVRTTPYSFAGWAEGSTSGTKYAAGASYTPASEKTMYATWTTGTTTGAITLRAGISKNNTTANGYKVTFNANGGTCDTANLTAIDSIKWTFSKWNTKSDGSGTDYNANASYSFSADTKLYAKWTSAIETRGSITLPTPTRKNYKFMGWATNANTTEGVTGSYTPAGNVTLYAIWKMDNSIVHYNNNGVDVPCVVYYNNNGTPVICNVYYNNNGTAVRI